MNGRAYYNEFDPFAAQWLRNLIAAGHIAPGDVDERSIEDVAPNDVRGYTQCHFFAGIGGWSYALRLAGWPDSRQVWTGSCPCQPFSQAGKGAGFADERHLWPAWFHLIRECKPAIVFGEQVASKNADAWIDLVHADVEAVGYTFGCVPFPSAGVGAPHIRDRNYWLADADNDGSQGRIVLSERSVERAARTNGMACGMAHANSAGSQPWWIAAETAGYRGAAVTDGGAERMADAGSQRRQQITGSSSCDEATHGRARWHEQQQNRDHVAASDGENNLPGPTNGFWRAADWIGCTDGKWRPVEPGTQPLAHGVPNRMGRLRAYGNAINAQAAAEFIGAAMT